MYIIMYYIYIYIYIYMYYSCYNMCTKSKLNLLSHTALKVLQSRPWPGTTGEHWDAAQSLL